LPSKERLSVDKDAVMAALRYAITAAVTVVK
jgi:hypothetical protein